MEYFENLEKISRENHIPIVLDESRKFLEDFCSIQKPQNILEIGTAVGYSGSIMLASSNDCKLTTIEIDSEKVKIANETFKQMNQENRVKIILGDAMEVLPKLNEKYDLIFLDGAKGQYLKYLPYLLNLLENNGHIIADNVLFHNLVRGPEFVKHKLRTIVVNMRKFLQFIENEPSLNSKVLDIGDGIAVISKKTK